MLATASDAEFDLQRAVIFHSLGEKSTQTKEIGPGHLGAVLEERLVEPPYPD